MKTIKEEKYRCLIDADILVYQGAFIGQTTDEETGELVILDFDRCIQYVDDKIGAIQEATWSSLEPILFFTGDKKFEKMVNRKNKREGKEEVDIQPNFRDSVATAVTYKGNRKKSDRPYHYYNMRAYLFNKYKCVVSNGCEADDMLCYYAEKYIKRGGIDRGGYIEKVIVCSQDKDLRIQEGYAYGWASGNILEKPLEYITRLGYLDTKNDGKKIVGCGQSFFAFQLLVGDSTDNIVGCGKMETTIYKSGKKAGQEYTRRNGVGAMTAYALLKEAETEEQLFTIVAEQYKEMFGSDWRTMMLENGRLLFMCNEFKDGKPVMWELPEIFI